MNPAYGKCISKMAQSCYCGVVSEKEDWFSTSQDSGNNFIVVNCLFLLYVQECWFWVILQTWLLTQFCRAVASSLRTPGMVVCFPVLPDSWAHVKVFPNKTLNPRTICAWKGQPVHRNFPKGINNNNNNYSLLLLLNSLLIKCDHRSCGLTLVFCFVWVCFGENLW